MCVCVCVLLSPPLSSLHLFTPRPKAVSNEANEGNEGEEEEEQVAVRQGGEIADEDNAH